MTNIAVRDLSVSFGTKPVLRGINLDFASGGLTGLIGPNGAGKSTLLRTMARLLPPDSGSIELGGNSIATLGRRELAKRVAYLPQGHVLHWPLRTDHIVALGRLPHQGRFGSPSSGDEEAVQIAMNRTDIEPFADRTADTLSGGERSRVMLARTLATEADVLLADEPVASLDPYHQLHVMELLRDLARGGVLVIAVLHDLPLAARFCDRLALLHEGELIAEGPASDVLARENLVRAYGVESVYGHQDSESFVLPWRRLNNGDRRRA